MSAILIAALPLAGCGNALDGGSSPSGSYITAEFVQETLEPDIFLSICDVDPDTGEITYEPGLTNTYATLTFHNNSAPNTPAGESTNNDVTMSRYRVDYTGLNKSVSIKSFDGPGSTVIVPKDGTAQMIVNVLSLEALDYIRERYPTVGNGETLELTATITVWGKDPFDVDVQSNKIDTTLIVDNYDRCD
jgi:hypothetical protein